MRIKYDGRGSFGAYDYDGRRLEARPGEELEVSDRLGALLLGDGTGRFSPAAPPSVDEGAEVPPVSGASSRGQEEAEAPAVLRPGTYSSEEFAAEVDRAVEETPKRKRRR